MTQIENHINFTRRWILKRHVGDEARFGYFAMHGSNGAGIKIHHDPDEHMTMEAFHAHIALGFPKGPHTNASIIDAWKEEQEHTNYE